MNQYDIIMWLGFLAFTGWVLWLTFSDMSARRDIDPEDEERERRRRKPRQRL
jgi:hypothetical protein